jgi:hypothetical protein
MMDDAAAAAAASLGALGVVVESYKGDREADMSSQAAQATRHTHTQSEDDACGEARRLELTSRLSSALVTRHPSHGRSGSGVGHGNDHETP